MDTRIPNGSSTAVRAELWKPSRKRGGAIGEYLIFVISGPLWVKTDSLNLTLESGSCICLRNEVEVEYGPEKPPGPQGLPVEVFVVEIV
jgi:hypothetical protein